MLNNWSELYQKEFATGRVIRGCKFKPSYAANGSGVYFFKGVEFDTFKINKTNKGTTEMNNINTQIEKLESELAELKKSVGNEDNDIQNLWQGFQAGYAHQSALLAKAVEALEKFSKQKLTNEMDYDKHDNADFIGAYDTFIRVSRKTLAEINKGD